jgi:hypothetical protein
VLLLTDLADMAAHSADVPAAVAYSEHALTLAQALVDEDSEVPLREAVSTRAFVLHMAGRHLEAGLLLEAAVTMARRTGNPAEQARAQMKFGNLVNEDDPRAALAAMLECASLASSAGMRAMQGLALANASEGAVDLGEWDLAEEALGEASLLSRDAQDDADGATMVTAMLVAHREDPVAALAMLDELDVRRDGRWDLVLLHTWFLRVRSLCSYLRGDNAGAARDAAQSLELDPAGPNAALSLWTAVLAGAALGSADQVRAALLATGGLRGQWTRMVRAAARAAISALEGEDTAAAAMKASLDAWTTAGLPLDHALTALCALRVLPTAELPLSDVTQARSYLEGLRATSLLRLFAEAAA